MLAECPIRQLHLQGIEGFRQNHLIIVAMNTPVAQATNIHPLIRHGLRKILFEIGPTMHFLRGERVKRQAHLPLTKGAGALFQSAGIAD